MSNSIEIGQAKKSSNKGSKALGDQAVTVKPITHFRDVSIDLSDEANQRIDELISSLSHSRSSEIIEYHSNVEFENIEDRIDQTRLNSESIGSLVPTEFLYSNGDTDYNVELQDFREEELIYEVAPFHPNSGLVEGEPEDYSGQEVNLDSVRVGVPLDEADDYAVASEEEIARALESYRSKQQ